jgi:hypothetical protein
MKVRSGFVSNSSSSSFCIVFDKKSFDEAMEMVPKQCKRVLEGLPFIEKDFMGSKVVCISQLSNTGGITNWGEVWDNWEEEGDEDEEGMDYSYNEALDEMKETILKLGTDTYIETEDWIG